jgi:chromosomal replication initiator protein
VHHHINDAFSKEEHKHGTPWSKTPIQKSQTSTHALHGRTDALSIGESAQSNDPRTHLPKSPDVCEKIREHLSSTQGHNRVRRYLSDAVAMTQTDEHAIEIIAGDRFTLDMIERRLGGPLRVAAQFAMGTTEPTITYRVDAARVGVGKPHDEIATGDAQRNARQRAKQAREESTHPLASRIPNRHQTTNPHTRFPACPTLEGFLVGASNRLAYESIKQVLQSGVDCPPVFIHGTCGVGKTHLLRGATQYARQLRPGCKVRYTTGEAFTNGFVTSIRSRTVEAFKKKFKGLELLCIDDVHLMAGKQATQHELLQIFNTLSLGGAKIILASDAHPREIARLDEALSSRFAAGLVVKVEEPDSELARRLVTHIASKRGVFLDEPAIGTIIERVGIGRGASVRDLEGAVLQIQAIARLMDRSEPTAAQSRTTMTPSLSHINRALSLRTGGSDAPSNAPIALDFIISQICQEMTVSQSDLVGKGRQKKVVMARELIVHTARRLTSKSFPEIAYAIGRPNHSTVITAAKRFKGRIAESQSVLVGCPHDGVPAGELAEMMARRVQS